MEAADSAKGTLVTGVVADETVEVVAPCIMGTFFRRIRQETREKGEVEGRRNVMSTMTLYARGRGGTVMASSIYVLPR